MQQQTIIAVYASMREAAQVRERLLAMGVHSADVRLSGEDIGSNATAGHEQRGRGFLDWLFGVEPPETDRSWYETNLRDGRTAVSVYMRDGTMDVDRIHAALEEFGPIELSDGGGAAGGASESEQVIPLKKEELEVGKRQTETRHRIRTYVVERPVEQQVELSDETVVIERRPAQGGQQGTGEFKQRDIEVVERHEQPVAAKTARADEEIVVSKTARRRAQTVRDTVRETKVEVDKASAGGKPFEDKE